MHEVSICQSIIDMVEEEFLDDELENIRVIHLKIGSLSNVQPSFLKNAYDFMIVGTKLKNSVLEFETTEIIASCENCRSEFKVEGSSFICPECGGPCSNIIQGNELLVDQIILEEHLYEETF